MKTKIVIVDDHILIANALKSIINSFLGFEVIYICENGLDLQNKIKVNNLPEIILLDISMPIMNGFETAFWLQKNYPELLIMALSIQDDDQSLIKMIQNGAKGYMLKNTNPVEFENGLIILKNEGHYFPEWAKSKIVNNSLSESFKKLSERELEFLKFAATELTYKEIADKMSCSPRTVENYRDSLCEKLELKSRIGLAVYAIKNNISAY